MAVELIGAPTAFAVWNDHDTVAIAVQSSPVKILLCHSADLQTVRAGETPMKLNGTHVSPLLCTAKQSPVDPR